MTLMLFNLLLFSMSFFALAAGVSQALNVYFMISIDKLDISIEEASDG